eukprot:9204839-Ditylum_brightwellii.AAC.1
MMKTTKWNYIYLLYSGDPLVKRNLLRGHWRELLQDPITLKASSNPDTLCDHQTIAAPDREEIKVSIMTEAHGHIDNNHWELVSISQVPKKAELLDSVWTFK